MKNHPKKTATEFLPSDYGREVFLKSGQNWIDG